MSEHNERARVYRPEYHSMIYYVWDFVSFVAGVFVLIWFHTKPLGVLIGGIMCLLSVWQFFTTRTVLGTNFITTEDEIISVSSAGTTGFRWDDIAEVVIRERESFLRPGAIDRLVLLIDYAGRRLPLNTSVLSRDDEEVLLARIREKVRCPIRTVRDSMIILRRDRS